MKVRELRALTDPFRDSIWFEVRPLTEAEVRCAVEAGWLLEHTVRQRINENSDTLRFRHICRVAFFVVHGWDTELTVDGLRLREGHHRFAAAIVRGDPTVGVRVQTTTVRLPSTRRGQRLTR